MNQRGLNSKEFDLSHSYGYDFPMNRVFRFAFSKLRGVKVYALVGRSGTGKSHHSKLLAQKHHSCIGDIDEYTSLSPRNTTST